MAINVFDLYAKLGLDSSGYDKGLDLAKNAAKSAGVAIGASMAAAATGAAALVKQSVSAYAEYEQLVGGVETLFSNLEGTVSAAPQVLENAANAYKTAGMSANEYMDTVTSFSAALIAGLKNDYDAAAKYADMAITDMSDNANKMGTSIDSIRTAYAGFAKQNYTMLDNLKLGYGGTKEEMQRLLDDAEKFSGVDYNISNLNDVYEAIHVIQTEMGITGTTAKEASETISGSIGMLSGAWTNLVAGFADKEADIPDLIDNVVDSAETAFKNLLPVTEQAINGLAEFVDNISPMVVERIPELVEQVVPPLLNTAGTVVNTLVNALPDMLVSVVDVVPKVLTDVSKTVIDNASKLVGAGKDLMLTFADGITDSIPVLVPAAVGAISEIAQTLTEPETLTEILDAGLGIVVTLAESIGDNIPEIVDTVMLIAGNIYDVITSPEFSAEIITASVEIVASLAGGILSAVPTAIGAMVEVMTGVTNRSLDPEWNDRCSEAGAGLVDSMSAAFITNSESFLESVENTLARIDNALGTHIEQWYKEYEKFGFDLGKWAFDVNAELYGLNDAIDEANKQYRVSELKNEIIREFNDAIRAGEDISTAYDEAREAVVQSVSDVNLYWDELSDYFSPEFLQQQADAVKNAVVENEAAAQAQRDAFDAMVAKGEEYKQHYQKQVREINVLNEEHLQGAKARATAYNDEVEELSEKELKALKKAEEKALKEQQKAAEKALKEQQKAAEKALKEYQKQVAAAKKAQQEAEAAQTKALEKAISDREKIIETYTKNVKSVYDSISDIEDSYSKSLADRSKKIYNSFSLFEAVPERIQISGVDLMNNLQNQIDRMELFYTELDVLANKGVGEGLVEAIRSQGVGALDDLDALLDLSDNELKKYADLYQQKVDFANAQAEIEMEGAKQTMYDAVADEYQKIDELTAEKSQDIATTFISGIGEGMKKGFGSFAEAATNALFGGFASSSMYTYSQTNTGATRIHDTEPAKKALDAASIVFNFNGVQFQNVDEMAEAMSAKLQSLIKQEGKAYA